MDIAITGSSGLIGSALSARLEGDGHRVVKVVRTPSSRPNSDEVVWDPSSGRIDGSGLAGLDAVVHLAGEGIGEKRWTPEQKDRIRTSRTRGTSLLATTLAGLDRPPTRLLSGSAIGYYGDTGPRPTDESGPPGDGFLPKLCVEWEAAARPAVDAGIPTTFLRTGVVLSTRGGALAKQLPFFKVGLGGRAGNGRQFLSWIDLDDHVSALVWLLTADVDGAVNLTSPGAVTNAQFTKALGRALRRPTTIIPMFGPRMLFGRELADTLLLESQHIVPGKLEAAGFTFRYPTIDASLANQLA